MTSDQWQFEKLLEKFHGNAPVSISDIRQFEMTLGRSLPTDYAAFLLHANGGEGWVGEECYVILWRLEEILETNKACELDEYLPGVLGFGSDGGGETFAFDMRTREMPVVAVPLIGMDPENVLPIAPNFYSFLVEGAKWD